MSALATVVEWDLLLEVVWVALAAGVAVTIAVSFGILGAARFGEARRSGSAAGAIFFGAVAALGSAGCLGAVAFGLWAMTSGG